jgi:hypothetical protein
MKIDAKHFKKATGVSPQDDDLERCNCPKAGEMFHTMCGWDRERDLPNFWPKYPVGCEQDAAPSGQSGPLIP